MKEFRCLVCGDCCKWGGYVYINEDDVERIAGHLSLSEFDFVNKYAELVNRSRLSLKSREDSSCIFLEKNTCAIHEVKPKQCVDFPALWRINDLESFCSGQKNQK